MSSTAQHAHRRSYPDWPGPGSIDLQVQDLPHASARMEWWYVNTHVTTADKREFSLFAAFFRVDTSEEGKAGTSYSHFLTWALADIAASRFSPHTLLDRKSPEIALNDLNNGKGPRDEKVSRALREVLDRGQIPLPDRLLRAEATVEFDRLLLDFDGNRFSKRPDGSYDLELKSHDGRDGCTLNFMPVKPIVRHGDDGVVRGLGGRDMFYYFTPRCKVTGEIVAEGVRTPVAEGIGWYDHEFGEHGESQGRANAKVLWNWVSAQLDNGYDITAYDLIDRDDPSLSHGRWTIVIGPDGKREAYTDFTLTASDSWTSTRTFNSYPTTYRLDVPGGGIHLDIRAAMPRQEVMTAISSPGFWEGRVDLTGTMRGEPTRGRGFIERSGFTTVDTMDDFLASVGEETRRAIDTLLPDPLTPATALPLIAAAGREHYLDGIDLEQFSRTTIRPLREMIFRGGKAWRSYSILSCMDLVGGDSQSFANWLALPELLHVGSLIIDDVQDGSEIRRGGPSCHKLYGDALAINAGCAAYFLAQIPIGASGLNESMRVRIYEAYFEAIRAAHAGQAFDIDSLVAHMPAVVESGDGAMLERRVLGTHRLKSAAPPAAIARMAAMIGGGTAEQAELVSRLFESYGLAFQIVDDVLNLRGFESGRKSQGEDIAAGKVTAPVAKAMGRLQKPDRQRLWSILESKPTDPERIREAIKLIDDCGALDACQNDAHTMVENSWQAASPVLPDSQFKVRMRSFGWFVLERHY